MRTIHAGMASNGKNEPPSMDMGKTTRLESTFAPRCVLACMTSKSNKRKKQAPENASHKTAPEKLATGTLASQRDTDTPISAIVENIVTTNNSRPARKAAIGVGVVKTRRSVPALRSFQISAA